jgi:hypothetical protein
MVKQKSKEEIEAEKTKASIEKVTRKKFSDFLKSFWKSVGFGKKRD